MALVQRMDWRREAYIGHVDPDICRPIASLTGNTLSMVNVSFSAMSTYDNTVS